MIVRSRTLVLVVIALSVIGLLFGCGSSKREGRDVVQTVPGDADAVQTGDPKLAAAAGYVGSQNCARCHPDQFLGWSKSLHNKPLKTVAELGAGIFVNDHDGNGKNDFEDGLDFNDPAFQSKYGYANPFLAMVPNAPVLSAQGGKFFITLGGTTYEVQRTQGGNGYWKQRYHTNIGMSYYILPVQYNERNRQYVAYSPANWYSGNTPLYSAPYGSNELVQQFGAKNNATDKKGTNVSWENRCAGCHQTGLAVAGLTSSYGGTDVLEVVTGYSELNIGCEVCHGPGATHAASASAADIINPDNFLALGLTGLRVANQVCGSCHSRGEGDAMIPGMQLHIEYPSRLVAGSVLLPKPGDSVVKADSPFVLLNVSSAYFGVPPLNFYTAYGDWYTGYSFPKYIASRQHHQQWTDMEQGPHAPDKDFDLTCWSCHNPHKASGNPNADPGDDHQIRDMIARNGVDVATRDDDNSLCLACHAGGFGISLADVKNASVVGPAVLRHMGKEAVMGTLAYDPSGTGMGRCSKCHMPKTASSAIRTDVGGGIREGDIRNHSFSIIWPNVVPLVDGSMPNSCYTAGCHSPDSGRASNRIIAQWSKSGHADFSGEPFRHWDVDGEVPATCAKCHSKDGFNDFVADGVVNSAAKLGSVLSCGACHSEDGDGSTLWDKRAVNTALASVVFPSGLSASLNNASNICMVCHQGRSAKKTVDDNIAAGNFGFVNIHYFAAAASFFGSDVKGGYEYDGKTYRGRNTFAAHQALDPAKTHCIGCHLRGNAKDHDFVPQLSDCTTCHSGTSFETLAGSPGTNKAAIDALNTALLAAIQSYAATTIGTPVVYSPADYPYFFKDTNANGVVDSGENVFGNRFTGFDAKLLKAAYNYQVAQKEPCGYIHNGIYIRQILFDSIADLGATPPGTRP